MPPATAIGAWWSSGEGVVIRYLTGIVLFIGLCYGILAWQGSRLEEKWRDFQDREGGTNASRATVPRTGGGETQRDTKIGEGG